MAFKDQIHIYSLDTSSLHTEGERIYYDKIVEARSGIYNNNKFIITTKNRRKRFDKKIKKYPEYSEQDEAVIKNGKNKGKLKNIITVDEALCEQVIHDNVKLKGDVKENKASLKEMMLANNNTGLIRAIDDETIKEKDIIAIFDSALTRTLNMGNSEKVHEDIIIIQVYYFEILKDIIDNGFIFKGEKYVYYASSNGQIKSKKVVFIKESRWMKYIDGEEVWTDSGKTLMCGLTFDGINKKSGEKGINPNKFNSYLSLNNSSTKTFTSFTIDDIVVVDNFETIVNDKVDYIDRDTFEIEHSKVMDVPIDQMDGCGIMLPQYHDKAFMFRGPYIKGLLVPFDFKAFISEKNANPIITDIYGLEHNVLEEDIKCIMTKSQFKLSKYYDSWDDYKTKFKENNCELCYANEEETYIKNAKINYQMVQTLSDMTDDEIDYLIEKTSNKILNIANDKDVIFDVLGITDYNKNKNYLQKAIESYPPLLTDSYTRKTLRQVKDKMVKKGKSAKVDVNGKYVFMIPDLYAFCENLFLGIPKPKGLLKNGEVSCNIYTNEKLACLRSPHLYREWGIRNNLNDENTSKWFLSNGLYMSSDDLLSKLVMNDWDSDKSLVIADDRLVEIAERHMTDINPVYYEMAIATSSELNKETRYNGLIDAYKGGGIGIYSNHIAKIWNDTSEPINIDLIRYLVMVNNFQIDYSKTLFKVEIPKEINKKISRKTKNKVPYFFKYVKDKDNSMVSPSNNSVMNRLSKKIPNVRINYKDDKFGEFNYKMLMVNQKFNDDCLDYNIIDIYKKNVTNMPYKINYKNIENGVVPFAFHEFVTEFKDYDTKIVVDNLVYYLFHKMRSEKKLTLWTSFGDVIYDNLVNNLKKIKLCENCGRLITKKSNKTKYCKECSITVNKLNMRKLNKKRRESKKRKEIEEEL